VARCEIVQLWLAAGSRFKTLKFLRGLAQVRTRLLAMLEYSSYLGRAPLLCGGAPCPLRCCASTTLRFALLSSGTRGLAPPATMPRVVASEARGAAESRYRGLTGEASSGMPRSVTLSNDANEKRDGAAAPFEGSDFGGSSGSFSADPARQRSYA
jgi:hypothetical protein